MAKLEHIFVNLLEKKNYAKNDLIAAIKQITGVDENKIEKRLSKLIESGKLLLSKNDLISLVSSSKLVDENYDEIYDSGHITLARKGKQTIVRSNFDKESHEQMLGDIKSYFPKFKEELNELINEIECLIVKYLNPLDALGHISLKNMTCNPEEYTESSFQGKEIFVEIVHNLVLKHDFSSFPKDSDFNKLDELDRLLDEYWKKLFWLPIYEPLSKDELSSEEQHVYSRTISHFLFLRGKAFWQHDQQIAKELFSNINHILSKKGFTIDDYLSTLTEIDEQINSNISNYDKRQHIRNIVHAMGENSGLNYKKFEDNGSLRSIYEIKLNEKINTTLLDLLALNFGSNEDWTSPLDISETPLRPIIKVEEKYYCFIDQHLIRNIIPIIESLLTKPEFDEYRDEKGNYFESKTLEIIHNILPNAEIYPKLEYPKRTELDGLVIYEDNLFLIEIKGKKRRCIACAENILKMTKEDVQEHINKTFEQSKRALEYIKSRDEVKFTCKEKGIDITIKEKSFQNIFLINVTADSFSEFTTDLRILNSWDQRLINGDIYPWNVNIYDLLVVTDLLENENDFIEYVSERVRLEKSNDIVAMDELNYLGYYLENGSLTKTEDIEGSTNPNIIGYTEDMDTWYSHLRGEVTFAEKPQRKS